MSSTDCVPDYPMDNIPTLLLYKNEDILAQWVGWNGMGGTSFGKDWLLAALRSLGL